MATDAAGKPVRFILTGGNVSDFTIAPELVSGIEARYIIADKGYDSQQIVAAIESGGARAVIPSRTHYKIPRHHNPDIYKRRNVIERAFNRLKHCRRIATRYDRKALYYLAFLYLAAAHIWGG